VCDQRQLFFPSRLFQVFGRQLNRAFQVKPYEGTVATRTGAYRPAPNLMSFPMTKV
ncbi:essential MCU regulator, partial [Tropilaelaps mercedesae]